MSASPLFGWRAWRGKFGPCGWLVAGFLVACGGSSSHSKQEVDASLPESVSALIDEKGGTLQASGVTVEIPAGALKGKTMISITKSG
jgi:hypothetical protein